MPSLKAAPAGTPAERKDVKASDESSVSEEQKTQAAAVETEQETETKETKGKDPEVDESDLDALEDQKKIPYGRFKEVNESNKALKQQMDAMKRQTEAQLARAAEDAELRVRARLERERAQQAAEQELDPAERRMYSTDKKVSELEAELRAIKNQNKKATTQAAIERLERKYAKADSLAVLGWAQARGVDPDSPEMEELMEASHNKTIELAKATVREMLEHKKAKAKAAVPTREGGIRLKDGEKPKNLKEAAALTRRFFGQD